MPRRNNSFAVSSLATCEVRAFSAAGNDAEGDVAGYSVESCIPVVELSPLSTPSTFARFERARSPLRFKPVLGEDPVEAAWSLVTCESFGVKPM